MAGAGPLWANDVTCRFVYAGGGLAVEGQAVSVPPYCPGTCPGIVATPTVNLEVSISDASGKLVSCTAYDKPLAASCTALAAAQLDLGATLTCHARAWAYNLVNPNAPIAGEYLCSSGA